MMNIRANFSGKILVDEPMDGEESDLEYRVERILARRKRGNTVEYLVKWKDCDDFKNTWEEAEVLDEEASIIEQFERERREKKYEERSSLLDSGHELEVVGCTKDCGDLQYLVEWKNTGKKELLPKDLLYEKCPQKVIKFLESRVKWKDGCKPG